MGFSAVPPIPWKNTLSESAPDVLAVPSRKVTVRKPTRVAAARSVLKIPTLSSGTSGVKVRVDAVVGRPI